MVCFIRMIVSVVRIAEDIDPVVAFARIYPLRRNL